MDQHSDPQYKMDDGSALRIWKDVAPNTFLSEQHGRPIFDEVTYVEVISPGSGNSTPIFEVVRVTAAEAGLPNPVRHRTKYPDFKKYIDDFESGEKSDGSLAGTPLSQWPEMTRTMVATLKVAKIFTCEALAALPDTGLAVVGPDGRTWREKAIAYIANAKDGAHATYLASQLEQSKQANADLQRQIAELSDVVRGLQAAADQQPQPPVTRNGPVLPPPLDHSKLAQPII